VIDAYNMLVTPLWDLQNNKNTQLKFCSGDVLQQVLEKNGVGNFDTLIEVLSGLADKRFEDCEYIQVKRTFPNSGVFTGHVRRIKKQCQEAKCVVIEWADGVEKSYTTKTAISFINASASEQNKDAVSKKLQLAENTLNVHPCPSLDDLHILPFFLLSHATSRHIISDSDAIAQSHGLHFFCVCRNCARSRLCVTRIRRNSGLNFGTQH
jgi:hypothetical protein